MHGDRKRPVVWNELVELVLKRLPKDLHDLAMMVIDDLADPAADLDLRPRGLPPFSAPGVHRFYRAHRDFDGNRLLFSYEVAPSGVATVTSLGFRHYPAGLANLIQRELQSFVLRRARTPAMARRSGSSWLGPYAPGIAPNMRSLVFGVEKRGVSTHRLGREDRAHLHVAASVCEIRHRRTARVDACVPFAELIGVSSSATSRQSAAQIDSACFLTLAAAGACDTLRTFGDADGGSSVVEHSEEEGANDVRQGHIERHERLRGRTVIHLVRATPMEPKCRIRTSPLIVPLVGVGAPKAMSLSRALKRLFTGVPAPVSTEFSVEALVANAAPTLGREVRPPDTMCVVV